MRYFDFAEDVTRAVREATDEAARLSAKTTVHRASLPAAVTRAGFRYLPSGGFFSPGIHDLVIGVAAWSDADLAALEELVSNIRSCSTQVTVFDIDELSFPEMLRQFPGIHRFMDTPVVILYTERQPTYYGEGHDAVLWLRQI
jgi:hypothetical protein